jgi:hypothetical protein
MNTRASSEDTEASNPTSPSTRDRKGATVIIGSVVRVLSIPDAVLQPLDEAEHARVFSMRGESFAVYDIDPYGGAWVEKWWHESESKAISHSLGLASSDIELLSDADA